MHTKSATQYKSFPAVSEKNCAKRGEKPCSQIYRLSEITLTDFSLLVDKSIVARTEGHSREQRGGANERGNNTRTITKRINQYSDTRQDENTVKIEKIR